MSGLEHVDFSDGSRDARLVAVVRDPVGLGVHEVGGQEGGVSEGGDFRSPPHEVGVGCSRDLVLFFGVEGDQLHVHVAERDVGVVAVDVLDELGAVGCFGPVGGLDHVVVDPLVVPEAVGVGDPAVGVFGGEDDLGPETPDDVVGVVDVVGVGVGAQVEREVRGGHPVVDHVSQDPVGVSDVGGDDSFAQGVARVASVGGTDSFGAVDHGEDAARFQHDGVGGADREDVDPGGAFRSGEFVDGGVEFVLRLGRGLGERARSCGFWRLAARVVGFFLGTRAALRL